MLNHLRRALAALMHRIGHAVAPHPRVIVTMRINVANLPRGLLAEA